MTLIQIIDRIKRICRSHAQLNTVRYGQASELLDRRSDNIYPLAFIDLPTPNISGKKTIYTLDMLFLDRVLAEKSNALEVESDMLEVARDIFALFNHPSNPWTEPQDASFLQVVDDMTADVLGGVRMTVRLEVPFSYDRCAVPLTGGDFLGVDGDDDLLTGPGSSPLSIQTSPYNGGKTINQLLDRGALQAGDLLVVGDTNGVAYKLSAAALGLVPFAAHIVGEEDQTQAAFGALIGMDEKRVRVTIEGADLTHTISFDSSTGTVTFNGTIEGQNVSIYA